MPEWVTRLPMSQPKVLAACKGDPGRVCIDGGSFEDVLRAVASGAPFVWAAPSFYEDLQPKARHLFKRCAS